MSNKEKYKQINPKLPIFMQSWWLDAFQTDWQSCLVLDKLDNPIAAMIYTTKKKFGITYSLPLPLSPVAGVWMQYPENQYKTHSKYTYEIDILSKLIEQLPLFTLYITKLGVNMENWLPFFWKGYKQKIHYTYIVENLNDITSVFENFNTNVKRNIKKGVDLQVFENDNVEHLYDLTAQSVQRSDGKLNFSKATLNSLYLAIKNNNAGQIFSIKNTDNQILASALIVWDAEKAYFLLAGDTKQHPSATTCLIWHILQKMSEKGIEKFDFEGSMLPHIEIFYRSFGAVQTPYHVIYKCKNQFWNLVFTFLNII